MQDVLGQLRVDSELAGRLAADLQQPDTEEKTCYGTILSRQQYLPDIEEWGFDDARLRPAGQMTPEEIEEWTRGIEVDGKSK